MDLICSCKRAEASCHVLDLNYRNTCYLWIFQSMSKLRGEYLEEKVNSSEGLLLSVASCVKVFTSASRPMEKPS